MIRSNNANHMIYIYIYEISSNEHFILFGFTLSLIDLVCIYYLRLFSSVGCNEIMKNATTNYRSQSPLH